MNSSRAREIFGDVSCLKKKYYKLALKHHPDKNGNTEESKRQFQEINDAYEFLKMNQDETSDNYDDLLKSFMSMFDKPFHFIPTVLSKLSSLEEMPKDLCVQLYDFICKNKDLFHLTDEFLEEIKTIVLKKYENDDFFILQPTIDDLLDHNLYKLEVDGEEYYAPLWHSEYVFTKKNKGEICVKCIPHLNGIQLDDDNNIYTEMTVAFNETLLSENIFCTIGKKVFEIPCEKLQIKKTQIFKLQEMGVSKNHTITNTNKSDIYITIHLTTPSFV